jgi:hypothetical protein
MTTGTISRTVRILAPVVSLLSRRERVNQLRTSTFGTKIRDNRNEWTTCTEYSTARTFEVAKVKRWASTMGHQS